MTDLDQAWVSMTPGFVYVASALSFQKALESSHEHCQHPCSTLAWMFLSGGLDCSNFITEILSEHLSDPGVGGGKVFCWLVLPELERVPSAKCVSW